MRARRVGVEGLCLCGSLAFFACSSDETLKIELQPPPGSRGLVLATEGPEGLEVVAIDLEDPGDLLPNTVDNGEARYRFTARYFDSVDALGVPPGRLPELGVEPIFGPVPYSSDPDSVLTVAPEGVSEWRPAERHTTALDRFLSPSLPIDDGGCFQFEGIASLPFGRYLREIAGAGGSALARTSSTLFAVRERDDGWQLAPLDAASPMSLALNGRIPDAMAGDTSGRFYLGICASTGSEILVGTLDDEVEVISLPSLDCPARILRADDAVVVLTRQGRVLWLSGGIGAWNVTDSIEVSGVSRLALTSDGQLFGLGLGRSGSVFRIGKASVDEEPLDRPSDEALIDIIAVGSDVFVGSFRDFIVNPALLYRRTSDGAWELLDDAAGGNELLAMQAVRSGFFFTSLWAGVTYFSPRDGECAQAQAFTSGVYGASEIAALDTTTFIVGGKAISAGDDFEDSLSIFRVTSIR